MGEEKWKVIEGYNYMISTDGKVKNLNTGRMIKGRKMKNGYYSISIYGNGKRIQPYIHRLVAQAFLTNPEGKPCVNHKDHNKENNQVNNLEWVTYKENNVYSAHLNRHPKKVTHSNTGEKYISYSQRHKYRVVIQGAETDFKTLDEAIKFRNEEIERRGLSAYFDL